MKFPTPRIDAPARLTHMGTDGIVERPIYKVSIVFGRQDDVRPDPE